MNVADGLRISSWRTPAKIAAVFGDKRLTYRELHTRSNQFAHALLAKGFKRGDKLSVILYNCTEFLEIYHAAARIGVIPVPINFRLVQAEREYIINNSDSKALVLGPEFVSELRADLLPNVAPENLIVVGSADETPAGMSNYEALLAGQPVTEPTVDLNEDDTFYFGYTSGTTGFPKGAMISQRAILGTVANALVRASGRDDVDMSKRVLLAIMPVCHSNSIWATLITFWAGGTNVIFPSGRFESEKVLQLIQDERVTTTSMVPTMITKILELPDEIKGKYDLSSLTSLGSSSAPLLTKTKEAALRFFTSARFSEGYGSTETGALTTLRHKDQLRKVRSIGLPNPGIKIELRDEDGNVVDKPGSVGVLWAQARSAFDGFYKDPAKTAASINGSWCSAGDMAYCDEEGYYFLVDRKNDMIISGGENIYPAEIEEVLTKHPAVSEAAVIGVPHEQWGEQVKAVVILREGQTATDKELLAFCEGKLAGYKRPRSIDFVQDYPRTATGKVLKRILKEPFWRDQERAI